MTNTLKEAFKLGTRLIVFDRSRIDPQAVDHHGGISSLDLDLPDRRGHRVATFSKPLNVNDQAKAWGH
jgi:NitT/TauT family transport system ATP-binding protein